MTRGTGKSVRLLSVLMALFFVLGAVRPAWSCPSQPEQSGCCCEPKADGAKAADDDDPRLAPVCCCEARPASEGTTSTPQVATTSSDRAPRDVVSPVVRPSLVAPALVLVDSDARAYRPNHGPPLQSLLRLRTLFLC
jgi:hypothetical protein